jgi:hypothetical protein
MGTIHQKLFYKENPRIQPEIGINNTSRVSSWSERIDIGILVFIVIRKNLVQIKIALAAFCRALPSWFRNRYLWILLLLPVLVSLVVYKLADANAFGWQSSTPNKVMMEIIHPSLLAGSMLLALAGWLYSRNTSLAFMGVMCAFTLARELGGQGTSFILYIGLLGLITYGYYNLDKLATLLESRLASSLMATCFIIYAISQLLDRGVAVRVGRLLLWDASWEIPYTSQIEESLETLGGLCLVFTVVVLIILVARGNFKSPPSIKT